MITDTFDNLTEEIIKVTRNENAMKVDVCIITFSHKILESVLKAYECTLIGNLYSSNGANPIFKFEYNNKNFAVYMSCVGAPACVADMEDTLSIINAEKYVIFGGAGCLNKEIARGKIMVPVEAYRDEGTSYHYAEASDYIPIKNADVVASFMETVGLPFVKGKTWTTDAIHRETRFNFERRKSEGCISVEMECAAVQAMCNFRNINVYYFLTSGDLLDSPKWDKRMKKKQTEKTQHDTGHFDIALELANFITEQ